MKQYIYALQTKASEALHRTRRDWSLPFLSDFDADTQDLCTELAPAHETYVTSVSSPEMAASLEVSVLLDYLCRVMNPEAILDLGSGFSSFVFRRHAQQTGNTTVVSVDDNASWLSKTKEYLAGHDLPTDRLVELSNFDFSDYQSAFDLVFHDLGSMEVRKETLPVVLETCCRNGLIVLDDIHKDHYLKHVHRTLDAAPYKFYHARDMTEDEFGRFSALVCPT
jgi:predicted O-methyltransferase YrrM